MIDRRKALRNMGLSLGYIVAAPTLISLVQSCKQDATVEWIPEFLTQDEGTVLKILIDIILPKTDTPAASDVQVHIFIDRFVNEIFEKEQKELFKMGMGKFTDKALTDSGRTDLANLRAENLEPVLANALKASKEEQAKYNKSIREYTEVLRKGNPSTLDDGASRYAFADNLRKLTIMSYKTSEYIGENILAYLPVPGEYIACGNLQELTGGKAWSI
ncbi:MAG TPA: gluconate 2-dehydrogenase subunit 3 family protein [Arenibacter sp.]|nr:gluconate 2-dehydrogenase subunit 3 family protein [Arenibacter sp.]